MTVEIIVVFRMNSRDALLLIEELDSAVLSLLPSVASQAEIYDHSAEAADKAKRLSKAAADLDRLLKELRVVESSSKVDRLKQEVRAIKEELQVKDDLLQECQRKLEQWKATCTNITETHNNNLFKDFS